MTDRVFQPKVPTHEEPWWVRAKDNPRDDDPILSTWVMTSWLAEPTDDFPFDKSLETQRAALLATEPPID